MFNFIVVVLVISVLLGAIKVGLRNNVVGITKQLFGSTDFSKLRSCRVVTLLCFKLLVLTIVGDSETRRQFSY